MTRGIYNNLTSRASSKKLHGTFTTTISYKRKEAQIKSELAILKAIHPQQMLRRRNKT